MRKDVVKIVDEAVKLAKENWQELSKLATDASKSVQTNTQALDKQVYYWENLTKCFEKNKEIKETYAGGAGSIFICWDENTTHHNIVVEIGLYAPLVAVYKYGPVPTSILDSVYNCIKSNELIILTDDEISELENNSLYHFIF